MNRYQESEVERAARYFGEALVGDLRRRVDHLQRKIEALERDGSRPEPGEGGAYLNQRQAADFLGCSTEFIRRQRRAGRFPEPLRLGRRDLRWSQETLREWAAERAAHQDEQSGAA